MSDQKPKRPRRDPKRRPHKGKGLRRTAQQSRLEAAPKLTDEDQALIRSCVMDETDAFLVVNKPPGLPAQTRNPEDRTLDRLLWAFAKSNGKRPKLVHRLDADTSGVIVVAKTQPAAAELSAAFEKRTAEKRYMAIVSGTSLDDLPPQISLPLVRFRPSPELELSRVARPDEKGSTAQTGVEVIARAGRFALLALSPKTGRMHQLRAHLAHVGCPIVGDGLYGGQMSAMAEPVGRMALHARSLSFPFDGETHRFDAPIPDDILSLAGRCGLEIGTETA